MTRIGHCDSEGRSDEDGLHARELQQGRQRELHESVVCVGEYVVWGVDCEDGGESPCAVEVVGEPTSQKRDVGHPAIFSKGVCH